MVTEFRPLTWNEAVRGFSIHVKATRAYTTYQYYDSHVRGLAAWADKAGITLDAFGKRHLDEFLCVRGEAGLSATSLHHDALTAKVFCKWCKRNDLLDRDPLADYEVRNAPKPHKYMPSEEDMRTLVTSMQLFWDVSHNPGARYAPPRKRSFHRDRNYAILLTLLDSACRIGEVLSLKVDDFKERSLELSIRESKGREPRSIPVSRECAKAVAAWLKIRARVMGNLPAGEDEGWLFVSETGSRIDEGRYLRAMRKVTAFAGLSEEITLHSLRRFSLNRLAKCNLFAAQAIAGHKDPKTTEIYTRIDPDHMRAVHDQVGVVRGVLSSKRSVQKKRLV